jgi:hypothetical protein
VGGVSGTLQATVPGTWGNALDDTPVRTSATFAAALAALRTPAGHDPAAAPTFPRPPQFAAVDAILATADAIDGAPAATVAALAAIGITPLVVTQIGCSSFDFTTDAPADAAYWAERWELYKHQYVLSRWTWTRGISKIECAFAFCVFVLCVRADLAFCARTVWNEPDLTATTTTRGATCMAPARWVEQYTLRSQAIQDAYADLNVDAASGRLACAASVACPLAPVVTVGAFARRTFGGNDTLYFGAPTLRNEHMRFPASANVVDASWSNLQAYSYHSYGKDGKLLATETADLATAVNAARSGAEATPLRVAITEHAAMPASSWNADASTADDYYQASRLASQLLNVGSYGQSSYIFKFSATPSSSGGVVKSGLHWGENTAAPYALGDATTSGEAARMIASAMTGRGASGGLPLLNCSASPGSNFRPCGAVLDERTLTLLLVNDKDTGLAVGASLAPLADATAAGLTDGAVAIVSEVSSAGFFGEVSSLLTLRAADGFALPAPLLLPAWGVLSITLPRGAQTETALPPAADASAFAGAFKATPFGTATTLHVGTSVTSVHDTTSVAFLRFDMRSISASSISAVLLELTVASVAPTNCVLSVIAVTNASAWADEASLTWASASAALSDPVLSVNAVSRNFVRLDAGSGADIAAHITVRPGDAGVVKRVDVTRYASQPGVVGFLVARRFRRNAYSGNAAGAIPADDLNAGAAVAFHSKEATDAASRPVLRVFSAVAVAAAASPPPLPAPPPPSPAPPPPPPAPSMTCVRASRLRLGRFCWLTTLAALHVSCN